MNPTIRPRDRDTVLQALRSGVVPRVGQHLVQVGRARETAAMIQDVDRIAEGGSAFRVVVGEYGAGKTFFLNLVRAIAQERKLVTLHADLNPERRLQSTNGMARSLYAELMNNVSTRSKPEGGALAGVIESFISLCLAEADAEGQPVAGILRRRLAILQEMVNGHDFVEVLAAYYQGHAEGNLGLKAAALRWLRGEYTTKGEARAALRVRNIIDDDNYYDQIKLFSRFVTLAGYKGLLVSLDEMVNLYKLSHTTSRSNNYEQILRILNDTLQGSASHLGFVLGGTPEFLCDTRRGLYSYPALQSRLAENSFAAAAGIVDLSGPAIRLAALTQEDFYVLLSKLRHVHASGDSSKYLLPDEALAAFMRHASERLGEACFRTPRTTIKGFLDLLAVLEQAPDADWRVLLNALTVAKDHGKLADQLTETADDDLTSFTL